MVDALVIGTGGAIGAVLRYLLSLWTEKYLGNRFPWGTLIVNVTGSFLLGVFTGWASRQIDVNPQLELFITVGLLGSFTTFAIHEFETILLLKNRQRLLAILNVIAMNILCIGSVFAGYGLGLTIG